MKTVLITGANKGIGFEVAKELGEKGFKVIVSARNEERGVLAVKKLKDMGYDVSFLKMDVSSIESIKQAFGEIKNITDKLDVLINNAAIALGRAELINAKEETIRKTIDTNSYGALFVTQTFLPLFSEGSRIINVSSDLGQVCNGVSSWEPVYSISKTLLNTITRHLARELSPKGISVNAVSPGWVQTDMGGSNAPRTVEKGAETIVWLASDAPQSITGKFLQDKKEITW